MKRIFFIALTFVVIGAEAKDLKKLSGTNDWLKAQDSIQICYDIVNAIAYKEDGQTAEQVFASKGEVELADWHNAIDIGKIAFCEYFNQEKSAKIKIGATAIPGNCKYRMDVHITEVKIGWGGGIIIGIGHRDGGMQFWGTIDIVDTATGQIVAKYNMEKIKGLGLPPIKGRMYSVSRFMAKAFIKM